MILHVSTDSICIRVQSKHRPKFGIIIIKLECRVWVAKIEANAKNSLDKMV